jgi:dipeptidyl aminopeptidase/acylaminoacyl peptidase
MFLGRDNYFINDLGIVISYPNIRGSTGYGKTFLNLDNGVLREGAYKDIGALLDWIKTQDNLDPNRILVQGASYGGHMALATSVLFGEKIRGVISVSGPSNLAKMLEHADVWVKDILRTEYGNERNPAVRNFFETFAPLKNVKKIRKELPFLIIQGANDPRVKMEESEQFVRAIHQIRMTDKVALNERSDNIWYILAKDEGHGFYKKQNRDYVFYASVLFVKRFLLN